MKLHQSKWRGGKPAKISGESFWGPANIEKGQFETNHSPTTKTSFQPRSASVCLGDGPDPGQESPSPVEECCGEEASVEKLETWGSWGMGMHLCMRTNYRARIGGVNLPHSAVPKNIPACTCRQGSIRTEWCSSGGYEATWFSVL